MFSMLAHITWQQWRLHKLRTLLTVVGIALGVAVFFAVRTANVTLLNSLTTTIEKLAGKATLQIVGGETGFPESVWDVVRDTPGVKVAEPVVEVIANTDYDDASTLMVVGVDMVGDRELREYQFDESSTQMSDPLVALSQPDSILIARAFADKNNLKEGDKLPLYTSQGRREFIVRGIFQAKGVGEVFGGQIAVMDVFNAQFVFGRGKNFDRIDLMNEPDVTVEELRERLKQRLPSGVTIEKPSARGEQLESTISAMSIGMTITSFIALLVGIFIIFNTFSIAVNQRWKEIGVLRAVGVERFNIRRMFLGEAAVMGLLGSALGVAGGFALAIVVEKIMSTIADKLFGLVSTEQPPVFRWDYALLAFGLGALASVIAAWLPAYAASQLNPIAALHNLEARGREDVLSNARLIFGLALIAVGMALIHFMPLKVGLFFQFGYSVLLIAGMTIILPRLSVWTARALRPLMDTVFGQEGVLAVDAMIQAPRRTSATVGALMIGLMFVFATSAYVLSYKNVVDRWMTNSINADLFVTATPDGARSKTWHFSEALSQKILAMDGVNRIENVRFLFIPYADDQCALLALELDGWFARAADSLLEGADPEVARRQLVKEEGLMVSKNFAARYGLKVGDELTLPAPTAPFTRRIAALVEDYTSEKGAVFIERDVYKKYWGDAAIDIMDINLKPGYDRNEFKGRLQKALKGEQRAFIYTRQEWRDFIMKLLDVFFAMTNMQILISVFTATIGIINTLIISTSERQRELGMLRAIGAERGQIRKMILLEAVAIALIGLFTGVIAGAFNTYFLVRVASVMMGGFTVPFAMPWQWIAWALPCSIVIAIGAAWWPARKAYHLKVVEAIGYE